MYSLQSRQRGFTLIEVLIALVISAIGLLGIAGIQIYSINSTSGSSSRAMAAIETSNLISIMKANPAYWENVTDDFGIEVSTDNNGDISIEDIDGSADNSGQVLAAQTADCTNTGDCDTPEKITAWQLQQWKVTLDSRLPAASVTIKRIKPDEAKRFPIFSIDLAWQEKGAAQNLKMKGSYYTSSNSEHVLANNIRTLHYQLAVQP